MSTFHPAVYGALYVALADQKRYKASAEAVADMYDNSATIAEYTSAIAGLQEAIALLHSGDADARLDDLLIAEADLGPMHCMLHNTPPIPPGEHCPECKADFDAADEALAQDEDQSATPARGHGQDNEQHAMWPEGTETPRCGATGEVALFGFAVTCQKCLALLRAQMQDLLDEESECGLDDDALVSHSAKPGTSDTRCNAGEDDPVYSNCPTCPTCRSLLRAERRGATTPPTGERP